MKCLENCRMHNKPCKETECRLWIDYEEDLNCISESTNKNGPLSLREVGKRLGISFVRVKQIEDKALNKLKKANIKNSF